MTMGAPAPGQLLIGFREGLRLIDIGLTKGKELVATGKLKVKRDGKLLKFTPEYLREYVENLPDASPDDVIPAKPKVQPRHPRAVPILDRAATED
jgi:hypothetical protein